MTFKEFDTIFSSYVNTEAQQMGIHVDIYPAMDQPILHVRANMWSSKTGDYIYANQAITAVDLADQAYAASYMAALWSSLKYQLVKYEEKHNAQMGTPKALDPFVVSTTTKSALKFGFSGFKPAYSYFGDYNATAIGEATPQLKPYAGQPREVAEPAEPAAASLRELYDAVDWQDLQFNHGKPKKAAKPKSKPLTAAQKQTTAEYSAKCDAQLAELKAASAAAVKAEQKKWVEEFFSNDKFYEALGKAGSQPKQMVFSKSVYDACQKLYEPKETAVTVTDVKDGIATFSYKPQEAEGSEATQVKGGQTSAVGQKSKKEQEPSEGIAKTGLKWLKSQVD